MGEFAGYVDLIKVGGPPVIMILAGLVYILYGQVQQRDKRIAELTKEKEEMYKQWREESAQRNERLTNALHNSTIAISDHSANADAIKTSLNAIMTFMAGWMERRRG